MPRYWNTTEAMLRATPWPMRWVVRIVLAWADRREASS